MTSNQSKLLAFVEEYRQKNGIGPSYREILRGINVSGIRSIHIIVDSLLKREYLVADPNSKFRSLRLTDRGRDVIGKNFIEARFGETFPAYQTALPFTIPVSGASIPTNCSSIAYKDCDVKNGGTTTPVAKSTNTPIAAISKNHQPSLFDGTSKYRQPLISVQNSTINFPLSTLDLNKVEEMTSQYEYVLPGIIPFVLVSLFHVNIMWFFILIVSLLAIRKLIKY